MSHCPIPCLNHTYEHHWLCAVIRPVISVTACFYSFYQKIKKNTPKLWFMNVNLTRVYEVGCGYPFIRLIVVHVRMKGIHREVTSSCIRYLQI